MRVLLVGDGAREHILAEQLARSAELYVAMEQLNPGIVGVSSKVFVSKFSNIEAIGSWAIKEKIDVALVTSERALAKGLPDAFADVGIELACPTSAGSVIGENRAYSYNLMEAAGLARPEFRICKTAAEMKRASEEFGSAVLKPSVRVEWKGTKLSEMDLKKKGDMEKEGKRMIKRHGSVIIEKLIDGESFTLQGFADGKTLSVGPPVQTVKRALEGNKGTLTEGMGGYSAAKLLPFLEKEDLAYARSCLMRLLRTMKRKGIAYKGPIRGEFMATRGGTMMLDAYATLGGMATLCNFLVLRTQFGEILRSVVEGSLKPISYQEAATVVKYLVPEKYPAKTGGRKREVTVDGRVLWNNGAKAYVHTLEAKDGKLLPTNDRTLAICAKGKDVAQAHEKVEGAIKGVDGKLRYRSDIGRKGFLDRSVKHMALLRRE